MPVRRLAEPITLVKEKAIEIAGPRKCGMVILRGLARTIVGFERHPVSLRNSAANALRLVPAAVHLCGVSHMNYLNRSGIASLFSPVGLACKQLHKC